MTTNAPRVTHTIAALHLPKPVPAFISLAKGIVAAMTSSALFPTPTPTLISKRARPHA